MPIYLYECLKCTKQIEVLRPMSEHDRKPELADMSPAEVTDCVLKSEIETAHDWTRIIGPVTKQYGSSWKYRKGNGYDNY